MEEIFRQVENEKENRNLANYIGDYDTFNNLTEKELQELKKFAKLDETVYQKFLNNEDFTTEELKFIYGLFKITDYFDYNTFKACLDKIKEEHKKRCIDIILERNAQEDLAQIYNCQENEIAFTYYDLINNNCKIFYGHFEVDEIRMQNICYTMANELNENNKSLKKQLLSAIDGSYLLVKTALGPALYKEVLRRLRINDKKEYYQYLKAVSNLEIIVGNLDIPSKYDSLGLGNLKEIWGKFTSYEIFPSGLNQLKLVDGDFYMPKATDVSPFNNLTYVGQNMDLYNVSDTTGLTNLEIICGRLSLDYIHYNSEYTLKHMPNLKYVQGPRHLTEVLKKRQTPTKITLNKLKTSLIAFFNINKLTEEKQLQKVK